MWAAFCRQCGHPARLPLLGALFESLVTLDVRVYAQATGASVGHRRTWNDDREIDLIVEKDRRLLAIEVKLATTPSRDDTAHLRWLSGRLGPDLADAMIVTTGRRAYRDRDGIAVVPAALQGAARAQGRTQAEQRESEPRAAGLSVRPQRVVSRAGIGALTTAAWGAVCAYDLTTTNHSRRGPRLLDTGGPPGISPRGQFR